jgi:hypothetical protein
MKQFFSKPSGLASIFGFIMTAMIQPHSYPNQPFSHWFGAAGGFGWVWCFAGAIAAWVAVEIYQKLRTPQK